MNGCRRGEHQAQCEAYRRCWRVVYPAVYNLLRNRQEAEDMMQESLLKGFEKLKELKDAEKYPSWQKQISIRMTLNKLKKTQHERRLFENEEYAEEDSDESNDIAVDAHWVNKKMTELAAGYRIIIQLHLLEELTHEEIAESLGIAASTSRSQYSRAIGILKRKLTEEHEKQI